MKKIPLEKIKCKTCGKIFFEQRSAHKKFCSIACYGKGVSKCQKGENNPMWKTVDINLLIKDYNNGLSLTRLANKYNISRDSIKNRFENKGIKLKRFHDVVVEGINNSKTWKETHKRDSNSIKSNRKNYLEIAKANKEWKCEICGALQTNRHFGLVVHHKDNNKNNNPNNLMILCQNCHAKIHFTKKKKAEYVTRREARL